MSKGYVRMIRHINNLMSDGKTRTTMEIYDYLKRKTKNGTTAQSLGNILKKIMYKDIERVGQISVKSFTNGNHILAQWKKRDIDGTKKENS